MRTEFGVQMDYPGQWQKLVQTYAGDSFVRLLFTHFLG